MKSWETAFPIKNFFLKFPQVQSRISCWHYFLKFPRAPSSVSTFELTSSCILRSKNKLRRLFSQYFLLVVFIRLHSSDSMFELKEMKTLQRKPVSVAAPFKGIVLYQISPLYIFNSFFLAARATLYLLLGVTEWLMIMHSERSTSAFVHKRVKKRYTCTTCWPVHQC